MELTTDQALQQGIAAHKKGDLQEAERLYRVVLQSQPTQPDANHNLGLIVSTESKATAALPLFKTALEAMPSVEQYWISYLDALLKEGQFNAANAVLEQGRKLGLAGEKVDALEAALRQSAPSANSKQTKDGPNAGDAQPSQQQLNKLIALFRSGKLADTETSALALTRKFPAHPLSWKILAAIYGQTGRNSDALSAMQNVVHLSPQDSEARTNLSYLLREAGRFEEAIASCKQAIALKPGSAEAHNDLGMMLQQLGNLEEAVESYRQAIALNNGFADAYSNMAAALLQLGSLEEAESSCRKVIELEPDVAFGHCDLGTVLLELGRSEESETCFRHAITLNPGLARAHYSLGSALRELCRLEDAVLSYRRAIELEPGLALAYSYLGVALKDLGRYEEAEESYRRAIALQPGFVDARYNLGTLLFEDKRYSEAAEQFDLIDIPQSKFYAIQCAYHQDEESIFKEKLETLIDQGEVNAVIGLLNRCAETKYGISLPNPFCADPLGYVTKTNLNDECDFENIFVKTAKSILADSSISHKDQVHLSNGIQTSGNFFSLERVAETEIENIIRSQIEKYRLRFKDSEEGFIKHWPTSYTIVGWLVSMQSGGSLTAHIHDTGWITGSIYINIPPKSAVDSGNLVLRVSDQEPVPGTEDSQENSIDLETGTLCFFPSSLLHHTVPFEVDKDDENRIVLAFDIIPADL